MRITANKCFLALAVGTQCKGQLQQERGHAEFQRMYDRVMSNSRQIEADIKTKKRVPFQAFIFEKLRQGVERQSQEIAQRAGMEYCWKTIWRGDEYSPLQVFNSLFSKDVFIVPTFHTGMMKPAELEHPLAHEMIHVKEKHAFVSSVALGILITLGTRMACLRIPGLPRLLTRTVPYAVGAGSTVSIERGMEWRGDRKGYELCSLEGKKAAHVFWVTGSKEMRQMAENAPPHVRAQIREDGSTIWDWRHPPLGKRIAYIQSLQERDGLRVREAP
jgi:hypothetical protein